MSTMMDELMDVGLTMLEDKMRRERKQKSRLVSVFDSLRDKGWEPGSVAGWDEEETARNYGIITSAHIPSDRWERLKEIERQEKAEWNRVMVQLKGVA